MNGRPWFAWIAAILAIAVLAHFATLHVLPRFVMRRALAEMGAPNTMQFARRADETSRRVVRPSPDLLYSACPYDLSKGPLEVKARIPHSTYWSVSAFDASTVNYFVRDNVQIEDDAVEIVILPPGQALAPAGGAANRMVVFSPTEKGMVLIRLLINDEARLAELDSIRHDASCATVAPQHP